MASKKYKFSRYGMYIKIENFLNTLSLYPGKCLVIGDSIGDIYSNKITNTALIDMLPDDCEIIAPPYPYVDIHKMPYNNEEFDYVMADQVLEHVRKPWVAVKEVHRILKKNGLIIFTTCLLQHIHGVPDDYWRFTKDGLKVLFEDFNILMCDQNGSLEFLMLCEQGNRNKSVKDNKLLLSKAIVDDDKYPLMVWIIAKK